MKKMLAVASGLFWLTSSAVRAAPPDCSTVAADATKIVYVAGSSALRPLLKNLGPLVAAQSTNNYTIVYQGSGSCNGVNGIVPGSSPYTISAGSIVNYYPSTYTDPTQPELTCTIGAATALDMGISDVFVPTCTGAAPPNSVGDFLGPAQAMAFVVPTASSQTAITAEEAYVLWGFGGTATSGSTTLTSTPWVDQNFQFTRPDSSGTKRILASVINVPIGKWKGTVKNGSGDVFNAVSTSTSAEATIGILGMDYLDQGTNRNSVKALAIAAYGQKYAYYPDSTQSARDKRNLRDGHYAGLGYAHLIAAVDSTGTATKPGVKYLIDVITGKVNPTAASYDPVKVIGKSAGLIPLCAMKVQRTAEGGDFSAYDPAAPCGCYYESLFGTPPASCVSCTTSCATGACRNGYCEAK
jgi:hypothetical protein